MADKFTRIAIVDSNKCRPLRCDQQCKRICPVVKMGKPCITVDKTSKVAQISEQLCISSCNICTKPNVCPFMAISVVNLPTSLDKDKIHRYNGNGFILHRLPVPKINSIYGIIGSNGTGKSTILKILSGQQVPNFGECNDPITDSLNGKIDEIEDLFAHKKQIIPKSINKNIKNIKNSNKNDPNNFIKNFKGNDLQDYFRKLSAGQIKISYKPQHIDEILIVNKDMTIGEFLNNYKENENLFNILVELNLESIIYDQSKKLVDLSGGELQRLYIGLICSDENANMYIFDEPTNYLDTVQRMNVTKTIRKLVENNSGKYVFVVDHDISILDYMSDQICMLYGQPSVYGITSYSHTVKEGLNMYLNGYIPDENMRIRSESIDFKLRNPYDSINNSLIQTYPVMRKTLESLNKKIVINIKQGFYSNSEITVLLGENGSGKTTFLRLLAGQIEPDKLDDKLNDKLNDNSNSEQLETLKQMISLKPQRLAHAMLLKNLPSNIDPKLATVEQILLHRINYAYNDSLFINDVVKPLNIYDIKDNLITGLSGGELQRVFIVLCLGNVSASIYLIDEPSAFVDIEQRINITKILRKYMYQYNKTAFIVEHDLLMASYLADKIIVFESNTTIEHNSNNDSSCNPYELVQTNVTDILSPTDGLNLFLQQMNITLRRDNEIGRPRINKLNSTKDKEQKMSGQFIE
jgi:ATP-binding cassette subfamily E protein 1